MKVTILKLCMVFLIMPLVSSCSKDDDGDSSPTYNEENFLESYLTSTGFSQSKSDFVDSGNYEFGLDFTPLVKGKITSLKVKLPAVNNSLRITIWDKATTTIIKTEIANVSTANTDFTFDIVDLELVKNKEYSITMNSKDWYNREKTDATQAVYPVTAGNIQLDRYRWASGVVQNFPGNISATYYAGDLSFNFIQID